MTVPTDTTPQHDQHKQETPGRIVCDTQAGRWGVLATVADRTAIVAWSDRSAGRVCLDSKDVKVRDDFPVVSTPLAQALLQASATVIAHLHTRRPLEVTPAQEPASSTASEDEIERVKREHAQTLQEIRDRVVDKYHEGGSICSSGLTRFLDDFAMESLPEEYQVDLRVIVRASGNHRDYEELICNNLEVSASASDLDITDFTVTDVDEL